MGGTGSCIEELTSVLDKGTLVAQVLLGGMPQSRIEAAAVLAKLSGETTVMAQLMATPGTYGVLVNMLGLASPVASEAAAGLIYRLSLHRPCRDEVAMAPPPLRAAAAADFRVPTVGSWSAVQPCLEFSRVHGINASDGVDVIPH